MSYQSNDPSKIFSVSQLLELAKLPQNQKCAECGTIGPRWASCTIGVFLCIRCAGLHRSLGSHVSKVKSLTLDSWTPEQVEFMKSKGNDVAKAYFEANLPKMFRRPLDERQLINFLKKKYDMKSYVSSEIPYSEFTKRHLSNNLIKNGSVLQIPHKSATPESPKLNSIEFSSKPMNVSEKSIRQTPEFSPLPKPSLIDNDLEGIFSTQPVQKQNLIESDKLISSQVNNPAPSSNSFFQTSDPQSFQTPPSHPTPKKLTNEEILSLYNQNHNVPQTGSQWVGNQTMLQNKQYNYQQPTNFNSNFSSQNFGYARQPAPIQPASQNFSFNSELSSTNQPTNTNFQSSQPSTQRRTTFF